MIFVQFREMALEGEKVPASAASPSLCCAGRAMLCFPCCCWIPALLLAVSPFEILVFLPEEDKLDAESYEARENVQS